jgi:hypothetical protein
MLNKLSVCFPNSILNINTGCHTSRRKKNLLSSPHVPLHRRSHQHHPKYPPRPGPDLRPSGPDGRPPPSRPSGGLDPQDPNCQSTTFPGKAVLGKGGVIKLAALQGREEQIYLTRTGRNPHGRGCGPHGSVRLGRLGELGRILAQEWQVIAGNF